MSTTQIRRDALWDSFCHWTENWDSALHTKGRVVHTSARDCACCEEWDCGHCLLEKYGMHCLKVTSPFDNAFRHTLGYVHRFSGEPNTANGKGIRFAKAAEHMALVLYLLYRVEGGRK